MSTSTPKGYAHGTKVSVEKTRAEIEALLKKHKASAFFTMTDDAKAVAALGFRLADRYFRLEVRVPSPKDAPPIRTHRRSLAEARQEWADAELRRRWRVQLILIKAKLETIASGDSTVEREFLADMLTADNETFGSIAIPALAHSYKTGGPPSLPMLGPGPSKKSGDVIEGEVLP